MPDFLTTKELAELLRIKERKVYDLAASGAVPCTRAMGKLLFPRAALDAWLQENSSGPEGAGMGVLKAGQTGLASDADSTPRPSIIVGSHDPLLDWAIRESGTGLAMDFHGSGDGLDRFAARKGAISALHLFDPEHRLWNAPQVEARFAGTDVVLVEWAKRSRGLVFRPDWQDQADGLHQRIEDGAETSGHPDLKARLARRTEGTGTRVLLDHLMAENRLGGLICLDGPTTHTEFDAALALRGGQADVTFGLKSVAHQLGLPFVPVIEERFDLLVDRRFWFEEPFQTLWSFCQSTAFREKATSLTGYDLSDFGRVHFNG